MNSEKTVLMRKKEGSVDYRFMPEPDLPPLVLNEKSLGGVGLKEFLKSSPELPFEAFTRLTKEYGLDNSMARIISSYRHITICFGRHTTTCITHHLMFMDNWTN